MYMFVYISHHQPLAIHYWIWSLPDLSTHYGLEQFVTRSVLLVFVPQLPIYLPLGRRLGRFLSLGIQDNISVIHLPSVRLAMFLPISILFS